MRLCANTGALLHLIEPLGFHVDDKSLRRAGLDYRDQATFTTHRNLESFLETVKPSKLYACSTRGKQNYSEITFLPGEAIMFGPETRGLPQAVLDALPADQVLRLPMKKDSRSLNLSNTVAIVLYEALRQNGFQMDE